MDAYLCVIVLVVGALVYLLCPLAPPTGTKEKVAELARIAYFAGLLVFLFLLAGKVVSLIPGK